MGALCSTRASARGGPDANDVVNDIDIAVRQDAAAEHNVPTDSSDETTTTTTSPSSDWIWRSRAESSSLSDSWSEESAIRDVLHQNTLEARVDGVVKFITRGPAESAFIAPFWRMIIEKRIPTVCQFGVDAHDPAGQESSVEEESLSADRGGTCERYLPVESEKTVKFGKIFVERIGAVEQLSRTLKRQHFMIYAEPRRGCVSLEKHTLVHFQATATEDDEGEEADWQTVVQMASRQPNPRILVHYESFSVESE